MIKLEKLPPHIMSRIPDVRKALAEDENVIFAYLFGGLAAGRANPLSDVDIAVYVKDTGDLADYKLSLFDRLTDALGTTELDLVVLNTAPISITGRILQIRQLPVAKEPFQPHLYESVTLRELFAFRIMETAFF